MAIVFSQPSQPPIKGQIIDTETKHPIPYAKIASFETYSITTADVLGYFSINLSVTDSIKVLSLGYTPCTITMEKLVAEKQKPLTIALQQMPIELKPVTIYKQNVNEHIQKLMPAGINMGYQNPTPIGLRSEIGGKPSLVSAVVSPATFLYYHLGKREKRMQKAKASLAAERAQSRMTKEMVAEITGLKAQELNDFFVYCNANIKVRDKDPNSYIKSRILDAYKKYQQHEKD